VADSRHTGMVGGRKNGRSRGAEPRRGSHASTPITRDSLTIGFPLAVTEIYRKPVHLVPWASGPGMRQIRDSAATMGREEIETRDPCLSNCRSSDLKNRSYRNPRVISSANTYELKMFFDMHFHRMLNFLCSRIFGIVKFSFSFERRSARPGKKFAAKISPYLSLRSISLFYRVFCYHKNFPVQDVVEL